MLWKVKKVEKKNFFLWRDFWQFLGPLLSITFPQGFRICKNIGHPTLGSGGKKTFKRYLKSEQTDRHTDVQTDGRTNRLIESIGPEGRCFENTKRNVCSTLYHNSRIHFIPIWPVQYRQPGTPAWQSWLHWGIGWALSTGWAAGGCYQFWTLVHPLTHFTPLYWIILNSTVLHSTFKWYTLLLYWAELHLVYLLLHSTQIHSTLLYAFHFTTVIYWIFLHINITPPDGPQSG